MSVRTDMGMNYQYQNKLIYFFAGSGHQDSTQRKKDLQSSQLLSQLNERKEAMEWVEFLRKNPDYKGKLFIDSGAYSAYTKGKEVDVDDYIKFINETGDVVFVFAQVDKIPQVIGREPTAEELADAPRQSWENYLYMVKRIKPEYRDKLIPVFHYEEDEKWLKNMLEYTHEDGSHIPYIGLAASTVGSAKDRIQWLTMCFSIIKQSSNPNVMTHGFGTTSLAVIKKFPLTSVDSTTWVQTAVHGQICCNETQYVLSDRRLKEGKNVLFMNKHLYDELEKKVESYNCFGDEFTLEILASDAYMRQRFNLCYLQDWANRYEYHPLEAIKTELW